MKLGHIFFKKWEFMNIKKQLLVHNIAQHFIRDLYLNSIFLSFNKKKINKLLFLNTSIVPLIGNYTYSGDLL